MILISCMFAAAHGKQARRSIYSYMSVLETFVRICRYRTRAAEFRQLAGGSFSLDVRDRYLAIANHYFAIADAEQRSDKLRCKERLKELRYEREKKADARLKQPQVRVDREAQPRARGPVKLRVIGGTGKRNTSLITAASSRPQVAVHLSEKLASLVAADVRGNEARGTFLDYPRRREAASFGLMTDRDL